MRSVADDLKADTCAEVARLDPMARVALALALGDEDASALSRARGIPVAEAHRVFTARRAAGRLPSIANRDRP